MVAARRAAATAEGGTAQKDAQPLLRLTAKCCDEELVAALGAKARC